MSVDVERYIPQTVAALGWSGTVLGPTLLMGRRVSVIAELLPEPHKYRVVNGWGPVTDRTTVGTWSWPEMQQFVPPVAVRLMGVIAPTNHWRTGLVNIAPFNGLCPLAVLLPHPAVLVDCFTGLFGISVVAVGELGVDVLRISPRTGTPPTGWMVRWFLEAIYHRLLVDSAAEHAGDHSSGGQIST